MRDAPGDDELRFEELFRSTRHDLLAYLLRRSASPEDAADLLAETYAIAWRKLDAIPAGAQARLWLFGVARNLLRRGARRRESQHALVERLARELRSAGQPTEEGRSEELDAALKRLPERQREIVLLTAWEGLTPKQIAAVTRTPVNLVRVRLHRARAKLRQDLADPSPTDGRRQPVSSAS